MELCSFVFVKVNDIVPIRKAERAKDLVRDYSFL
jgi:hypothetical protein